MQTKGPGYKLLYGAIGAFIAFVTGPFISKVLCCSILPFFALGFVVKALEPIARRRGWGAEGRLTRHFSRPPFVDRSKQFTISS